MGYGKWTFCWPERQLWSLWKNNPGCQNQVSFSKKRVKFKKYKHEISPWITSGILNSIKGRGVLHQRLVATPNGDSNNIQLYEKLRKSLLKKTIRLAKAKYYTEQFDKNRSNIRHTWTTIKEILDKLKNKSDFPDHFTVDGKKINDPFQSLTVLTTSLLMLGHHWPVKFLTTAIALYLLTSSNA